MAASGAGLWSVTRIQCTWVQALASSMSLRVVLTTVRLLTESRPSRRSWWPISA